tara:strand:- start:28 stop:672 length:645 start_codon:yes stop_codon:yes gene_type:complete
MRLLNFNKVLCLSPHPDDVELGMMGTIMKYHETEFTVLCLTNGATKCLNGENGKNRLEEVTEAWRKADVNNVTIEFSDCEYLTDKDGDSEWINYIEENFINSGVYDCIFLPTSEDSQFEHRFVNGLGNALIRSKPISLVEYRTPSTLNSWLPNSFVDVGKHYGKKLSSLKSFKTQQMKPYFSGPALEAFHANYQCRKKGIYLVEPFRIIESYIK